ncbi:MAG: hypothetical protein PHW77_07495, partial [Eubacteriales bacterium]|nr:hypothetical protein [Eubacteriales bacterium]
MKKILCLLLCTLLMLSALLVGCGKETDNESETGSKDKSAAESSSDETAEQSSGTTSDNSTENPYVDSNGKYVKNDLPEFKDEWNTYTEFRVLVYNNTIQDTYFSEEIESLYSTTDTKIVEGVNDRNKWIEDNYGIKIKAVAVENVLTTFRNDVSTDLNSFDVAMPFMAACAALAQEGYLHDLCEFSEYIDLEAPWWDQNATDSL